MDRPLTHGETFRTAGATADKYSYQELPSATQYIRLLELDHDESLLWLRGDVRCKLTVWLLEAAPEYHAISYVWGDSTRNCKVTVDGCSLPIPQSSYEVLRQLSLFDTSRYYFIDSICIQQDDLGKKSGQVAAMGEVYRRASHVLVCLGWVDDGAEAAMHMIAEIEPKLPSCSLTRPMPFSERTKYLAEMKLQTPNQNEAQLLSRLKGLFALIGGRLGTYLEGVAALSRRPYFQRMWIVQELLLARAASVCSGSARASLGTLDFHLLFGLQVRNWQVQFACQVPETSHLHVLAQPWLRGDPHDYFDQYSLEETVGLNAQRLLKNILYAADGASQRRSLAIKDAAFLGRDRLCKDRRDRIFSMLALIDWTDEEPIVPDYSKSVFQLLVDIFRNHLHWSPMELSGQLLELLAVPHNDTDFQNAVARRQNSTAQLGGGISIGASISIGAADSLVDDSWVGKDLSPESCRITQRVIAAKLVYHVALTESEDDHEFLALNVQMFDSIVWHKDGVAMVVRPYCGVLVVVCRATCLPLNEPIPIDGQERYLVIWEPEDFVVASCLWSNLRNREHQGALTDDAYLGTGLATPVSISLGSSWAVSMENYLQHGSFDDFIDELSKADPGLRIARRSSRKLRRASALNADEWI